VSTIYSPHELEAMAQVMEAKQPPAPSRESYASAPRVLKFALFGDERGAVIRFRMEDKTVRNLAFHPLVASYLAAAIVDLAEKLAWGMNGETFHPDAVALGLENPEPDAEKRWDREWAKTKVAAPDQATFTLSPKVVALNGEGALDAFVTALVLDSGELTHLRMSPVVAWELSGAVHDVGTTENWWDDLGIILPGRTIN
jgi:hypothetical protein